MVLTREEKQEISAAIVEAGTRPGAALEALRVVQRHRGWVSDEALAAVAAMLKMTPAELEDLASFFSMIFRRPVGRHVILLCDSISCYLCGYEGIKDDLTARLGIGFGETTADGRFTLLPVACLGACDQAPALMIDEELHVSLTAEKLERLLERYP
ncbi:MAG TPA: NADH-quinone oxidoreductase subunit NuoE [Armatimonadota bacterium]|jgi:NADH-quinone oxidoreductase subunit E